MKVFNGKILDKELPPSQRGKSVVTVTTSIPTPSDRIPKHVWAKLAGCGESAVNRLATMIEADSFAKLRASDQLTLIKLALEYAYGKPEGPIKRKVKETFEGEGGDAIARLTALADKATLPEYLNAGLVTGGKKRKDKGKVKARRREGM